MAGMRRWRTNLVAPGPPLVLPRTSSLLPSGLHTTLPTGKQGCSIGAGGGCCVVRCTCLSPGWGLGVRFTYLPAHVQLGGRILRFTEF